MDIKCARCGEPWEAFHLRHDMSWWRCQKCERLVERRSDSRWALHRHETTDPLCDRLPACSLAVGHLYH